MIKKLIIFLLFAVSSVTFAQRDPLANYYNKTHRQLAGSPTASTRIDTLIFTAYIVLDSAITALDLYGVTGFDSTFIISLPYTTIDSSQTVARGRTLIIPFSESTSDTTTALNDSTVIWDFRWNRWDVYGKRTWGTKSVMEIDSSADFKKAVDSLRAGGVLLLGDGSYSFVADTFARDSIDLYGHPFVFINNLGVTVC